MRKVICQPLQIKSLKLHDYSVNHTVLSERQGAVIIISENNLQNGRRQNNPGTLYGRPREFAININKTAFKKPPIKDIRVNRRTNVAAVEISKDSHDENLCAKIDKALKVTKIEAYEVNCYISNRDKYKYGVITSIGKDEDLDSLLQDMQQNNNCKIVKLDRLGKRVENNDLTSSLSVKITFEESKLPNSVKCGYFKFKVRPYVFNPTQCFKCQRLWHNAASCKGKERCLKCAEAHNVSECTTSVVKCANCAGNHRAN